MSQVNVKPSILPVRLPVRLPVNNPAEIPPSFLRASEGSGRASRTGWSVTRWWAADGRVRVTADKFTRTLAWPNRAEAGKVVLVRGAWIDAFLGELIHFPNAAQDDQVDAVSLAVQMIDTKKNVVRAS